MACGQIALPWKLMESGGRWRRTPMPTEPTTPPGAREIAGWKRSSRTSAGMDQPTDQTDGLPFGLRRTPFQPTADPDFFFPGGRAPDALDRIATAVRNRRGLCVLTGEPGTGKTMVLRRLFRELAGESSTLLLCGNAPLGLDDVIGLLGGIPPDPAASGEAQRVEVKRRLRELEEGGQ